MDLCELQPNLKSRHPWEIVRIHAIKNLLMCDDVLLDHLKILDIGCGDGFTVAEIFKNLNKVSIDAVDINLTDDQVSSFSNSYKNITFYNSYDLLLGKRYNLIILLDVIEHVEDDLFFLKNAIKLAAPNSYIFIAAPAFNSLLGNHDKYLGHYRRYNKKTINNLVNQAGLKNIESGYLFFSLLPLRFISIFYERLTRSQNINKTGVGSWKYSQILSRMIIFFLKLDIDINFKLKNIGINLPGLSIWSKSQRQQ